MNENDKRPFPKIRIGAAICFLVLFVLFAIFEKVKLFESATIFKDASLFLSFTFTISINFTFKKTIINYYQVGQITNDPAIQDLVQLDRNCVNIYGYIHSIEVQLNNKSPDVNSIWASLNKIKPLFDSSKAILVSNQYFYEDSNLKKTYCSIKDFYDQISKYNHLFSQSKNAFFTKFSFNADAIYKELNGFAILVSNFYNHISHLRLKE